MEKIILFGAGKSATCLISYLVEESSKNKWHFTVVDADADMAKQKVGNAAHVSVETFDINDGLTRGKWIRDSDLVISLLPATLHILVAKDCIRYRKHLLTASYISPEIQALQQEIKDAGVLFMGEMGLDPGIDHMSAMKILDNIRDKGHQILSFEGYCGALMAPESNDNPWKYKFSWSPMAVVLAGAAGATYRKEGESIHVPYEQLFHTDNILSIPGFGELAYYPNRDSLPYAALYHLEEVPTVMRATLRYPEFCSGWDALVALQLTDNKAQKQADELTYRDWAFQHIIKEKEKQPEELLASLFPEKDSALLLKQFDYLGLFTEQKLVIGKQTNAEILLSILTDKLAMQPTDKDMVIMLHKVIFSASDKLKSYTGCLVVKGDDQVKTAIAKTVGLPLGILAKLILTRKITLTGLHIPVMPEVYLPVLEELEMHGIKFEEYIN